MNLLAKILLVLMLIVSAVNFGVVSVALKAQSDWKALYKAEADGRKVDIANSTAEFQKMQAWAYTANENATYWKGMFDSKEKELTTNLDLIKEKEGTIKDLRDQLSEKEGLVTDANSKLDSASREAEQAKNLLRDEQVKVSRIEKERDDKEDELRSVKEDVNRLTVQIGNLEQEDGRKQGKIDEHEKIFELLDRWDPNWKTKILGTGIKPPKDGRVLNVNEELGVVQISTGSSDGVVKGWVYHIVRNGKFVADVEISDVTKDRCYGKITLKKGVVQIDDVAVATFD